MSKKRTKTRKRIRSEPNANIGLKTWLCSTEAFESLCCGTYTSLMDNPEIMAAVNKISDLISSMTIYEMENSENGDVRIKDGLSRLLDINPNPYMTRKSFISVIVKNLLLDGDGNAVVEPITREGYIVKLNVIQPNRVNFICNDESYDIYIDGEKKSPEDLLHFVINPSTSKLFVGTGYKVALRDIAQNLKQATKTQKGFMESKWKPSVIVKADGLVEEFSTKEGRKKILTDYMETSEAGEPWIIPAETFDVEVVKPLSLTDLAISDSVILDKKTVASILGVPPFVLGAGEYKADEWDNFINTRIRPICNALEQEFTKKLLYSPARYFKFSVRSLYSYDLKTLADVGSNLYTKGIMTGNQVRDWVDLSPMSGLDELVMLENYIPADMIGSQNKLNGGE